MIEIPWRVGLGWLVGRWWLLLTTQRSDGSHRRTLLPYRYGGGNFYVPAGGPWMDDLASRRTATLQAHPGPLSVRGRLITDPKEEAVARSLCPIPAENVVVLEATGEPGPQMLPPDYAFAWVLLPLFWWIIRRIKR